MIFETVKTKFGGFDALIHITGEYDYNLSLLSVERWQWDLWVDNFINIPGLIVKEAVNIMASPGAIENPASYRGSHGCIVIIGPDSPVGNKVSGLVRARSEIFRGALRPYTATVNQELRDVLGSKMCVYLLLPGNIAGSNPSTESVTGSVTKLLTEPGYLSSQVIFYLDE
jgi:hypothetical protein